MTTVSSVSAADQVRTAFDFEIAKVAYRPDESLGWKAPAGVYGLHRNDTGEPLDVGTVTSRYTPHQTEDVIALVDACESVFDESAQVRCHFNNGHYVSVAPSDEYRRSIYEGRDNIFPRLMIRGGFNKTAFSVTLGMYRDACSNLAMLRSVKETYQTIRHTSGLRLAMDELVGQFQTLKEGWQTLTNLVVSMEAAEVNLAEFLDQVYVPDPQADAKATRKAAKRTAKIVDRLNREAIRTGRQVGRRNVSAWEAYNAVQGYQQWNATVRNARTPFDRILKASDCAQTRKAESLAIAAAA